MDAALPMPAAMKLTASQATKPMICLFFGKVTIHSIVLPNIKVHNPPARAAHALPFAKYMKATAPRPRKTKTEMSPTEVVMEND